MRFIFVFHNARNIFVMILTGVRSIIYVVILDSDVMRSSFHRNRITNQEHNEMTACVRTESRQMDIKKSN